MRTAFRLRCTMAIAAVLCAVTVARAIERTKIPAFSVVDRQGRVRSSESLQRSGAWLLVVVHPQCGPCESMLRAVAELSGDESPARIVILFADGAASDVSSTIARVPSLAAAEWLTTSSADVSQALKLPAASALFGVRGNMIEWSVSGVLTDSADVRSIAASWLSAANP